MANPTRFLEFRDERPNGPCTQTFFRNQEVIGRTLRAARAGQPERLRILDIGGGVLEPLLIAALCELSEDAGYLSWHEIKCLDLSAEVCRIHGDLRAGRACEINGHHIADADRRLSLPGLARVFGATHAELNSWLIDPVALSGQLQRWIDMGIGHYMGIPPDACQSAERMENFVAAGLGLPRRLVEDVQVLQGDLGSVDSAIIGAGWADVLISNYTIQYPIWDGNGQAALRNLESWLAPDAVVEIGNAYSAQRELLALIDRFGQKLNELHLELLLREAFIVAQYATDAPDGPPRLVPRMDAFFASDVDRLPHVQVVSAEHFTRKHDGVTVSFTSLGELSDLMATHTGLQSEMMLCYATWNPNSHKGVGCLLPRELLLSFGRNPIQPNLFG